MRKKIEPHHFRYLFALPIAMFALSGCGDEQEQFIKKNRELTLGIPSKKENQPKVKNMAENVAGNSTAQLQTGSELRKIISNGRFRPRLGTSLSFKISFIDEKKVIYEFAGEAIVYHTRFYSLNNDCVIIYEDGNFKEELSRIKFYYIKSGVYELSFISDKLKSYNEEYERTPII